MGTWSEKHYGQGMADCPICGGCGYVRHDVDEHDPRFAKIFDCQCRRHAPGFRRASGLPEYAFDFTEAQVLGLPGRQDVDGALRHFLAVAPLAPAGWPDAWKTITGPWGDGKSVAVLWLAAQLVILGQRVFYLSSDAWQLGIMDSFSADSPGGVPTVLNKAVGAPILIADNVLDWCYRVDGGNISWSANLLLQLVEARNRTQLATIWVVNPPFWKMTGETVQAIQSRLRGGDCAITNTPDLRPAVGEAATARRRQWAGA